MDGCYLDIAGTETGDMFQRYSPDDRRIIEGHNWREGEELAFRQLKQANPQLAFMCEGQSEWVTIHTFYNWEGLTHITHPQPVRVNHPLRAACWGSYT
jgi:hypothetical protein